MCNLRSMGLWLLSFLTRSQNVLRKYTIDHEALSFWHICLQTRCSNFWPKWTVKMLIRNKDPDMGQVWLSLRLCSQECHSYATRTVTSAMYIKSDQTHHPLIAMSFLSINFMNCWSSFLFPLTVTEMFWWMIVDVDCETQRIWCISQNFYCMDFCREATFINLWNLSLKSISIQILNRGIVSNK